MTARVITPRLLRMEPIHKRHEVHERALKGTLNARAYSGEVVTCRTCRKMWIPVERLNPGDWIRDAHGKLVKVASISRDATAVHVRGSDGERLRYAPRDLVVSKVNWGGK